MKSVRVALGAAALLLLAVSELAACGQLPAVGSPQRPGTTAPLGVLSCDELCRADQRSGAAAACDELCRAEVRLDVRH